MCMDSAKDWAELLSGLMTPLIAVIAVYIAWRQHKTATAALRLDLYERRHKVYRGLMDLFAAVLQEVKITPEVLGKYYADTSEKKFLFDDEIIAFMSEVRDKALDLRRIDRKMTRRPAPKETEMAELSNREHDLLTWFSDQLDELPDRFEKPLGFTRNL